MGRQGEAGQASVELALVLPLLMVLVLSGVQAALWFHAAQVVTAAAQEGAAAARAAGASAEAGHAAAGDTLDQLGRGLVVDARVAVVREPDWVKVQVMGQAPSLLPGLHPAVHGRAQSPLERLRPETER